MKVCTIYDKKAKSISPLFLAGNAEVAKRIFVSSLREDSPCVLYASDFELRIIGEVDELSAEVSSLPRSSSNENGDKYESIPVTVLIPDRFKSYCLDGSFDGK